MKMFTSITRTFKRQNSSKKLKKTEISCWVRLQLYLLLIISSATGNCLNRPKANILKGLKPLLDENNSKILLNLNQMKLIELLILNMPSSVSLSEVTQKLCLLLKEWKITTYLHVWRDRRVHFWAGNRFWKH